MITPFVHIDKTLENLFACRRLPQKGLDLHSLTMMSGQVELPVRSQQLIGETPVAEMSAVDDYGDIERRLQEAQVCYNHGEHGD